MRILTSASLVTAATAASLLLGPAAYATPPGDNGTVKIHDAKTGEELHKNEPHVCTFYLDAFGFDGGQKVDWSIVAMPPTGSKGAEADKGSLTLDGAGHGRTGNLSLPDGHYKLIWNFDGEHGRAKHKVFWTDCKSEGGTPGGKPSGKPSAEPSSTASQEPSQKPSGAPADTPSDEPSVSASASAVAPAPSSNGGGGNLAETGTSVVGISAAAALLLGVGGALTLRRRTRGQG
ncbi:hypothetical protein AB0M87_17985 [Streptomyces sp. NPDC051320]|uniref:hypothetical protein n=1 Tax=Streptomyces sp. NPDC051320 TaxID=3154644 RepID=UPI003447AFE8